MNDKSTILNKKVEIEDNNIMENFLIKISPYLILFMMFLLLVMFLWVMIKYGHNITGTEANNYYYHLKYISAPIKIRGFIYG